MASTQTITAVLFDFDGTIFDLDLELDEFKRRWTRAGRTVDRILNTLEVGDIAQALLELEAAEMDGVRRGRPIPGAAEIIAWAQARYRVAVVSRNGHAAIEAGLAAIGVSVEMVVGREDCSEQKPAPGPIHLALRQLGATDGVLIGDTAHDVQAAAAAGIPSIIVRNSKLAFIPEKANYYVNEISEIGDVTWDQT